MDNDNTQVDELLERLEHVPDNYEGDSQEEPLVPFPSDLELNREQEDTLMQHCTDRIKQLEEEMGRNVVATMDWWTDAENRESGAQSWMGKRERYEATFNNDVTWRAHIFGGIFAHSNLVVPMARRICRQMVARANNYFFGTQPWFSATAERGTGDDALAEKVDQFAKFKLRQSNSKAFKETGIKMAFIRGESVMKSVYKKKVDYYQTTTDVLVDVEGEPILTTSGDYIFPNDQWGPRVLIDEVTQAEEVQEGVEVLQRDPDVMKPEALLWARHRIRRQITQFDGSESKPVFFKDFLCPLDAETVEDADCVVHLYDMPLMDLAEMYRTREILTDSEEDERKDENEWKATIRAVDLLRELSGNDGRAKSAKNQVSADEREESFDGADRKDPIIGVAECHLYYDADGDGVREHIMVVMDRETMRPIFYDYEANVTPDGMRPFTVIRAEEVADRWYGIGAMEMFDTTQQIIDLLVNRWNFQQSSAGRVTFWNPALTIEGDRNPNLKLNDGGTYTPKPNVEVDKILQYVNLPDVKHESIKDMFEFFMQMAMNESGVQHANDANSVGLDQAKLATGIRNIEKSGMEMFGAFISNLEPGTKATLEKEVNLIFANLDKAEAFEYFDRGEQNDATTRLLEIEPDEVRDMVIKIKILLTRYQGEQLMQQASVGWNTVKEYYMQPPEVQERTTPFVRMMIKALDLAVDADAIIVPLPPLPPSQGAGVDGAAAAGAVKPIQDNTPNPNL